MSQSEDGNDDDGGGRPSRRAKKNAVNYGVEQEFSDEDLNAILGQSSEEEAPVKASRRSKSTGGRKSKGRDGGSTAYDQDDHDVYRPAKTIYTEKGYDPTLPSLRERFPFLPEYEADGTPKLDLIVGRRPVDDKDDNTGGNKVDDDNNNYGDKEEEEEDDDEKDHYDDDDDDEPSNGGRCSRRKSGARGGKNNVNSDSGNKSSPKKKKLDVDTDFVEYEYLVKYKNRSYLHLEWKKGADLDSMGKSVKMIYRRFVKKVEHGQDEELEDPDFDPTFVVPQKILAEEEQELELELTDKELLKWEKQKEKELAQDDDDDDDEQDSKKDKPYEKLKDVSMADAETTSAKKDATTADWTDEEVDFSKITVERLKEIDGPYFHNFPDCDNPYRDGYVTEPPKKPRASYLVFQCIMRPYFTKQNPNASLNELMTIIGDTWKSMSDMEQEPFLELARQEAKQYEKERALMERAQKPNEMWQPIRRCMKVLDRICEEGYSDIFKEPVDLNDFPDYEEIVETPMDLGTVRKKLKDKTYQMHEAFARDMRKIWNNCKIYNNHGSQIWHVADYMSKMFERLYHAWVLDFREKYIRWANPKARPWEESCRIHEGQCTSKSVEMLLCDHCDAMYGFKCLSPPLKKPPKEGHVWHCPECKPKLRTAKGARMLSAVAENAARKRADLGDTPKRKVKEMMYLVKWAGLGYEYCTWETKADVGNPALITEFRRLNNSSVDEPEMPAEFVSKVLETTEHINRENAGGVNGIADLRTQLYAQTRAFEFTKFGMVVPSSVSNECGPLTKSSTQLLATDTKGDSKAKLRLASSYPREVLECVNDISNRVAVDAAFGTFPEKRKYNLSLPPLMSGEYDTAIPVTSKGLLLNVGEINGSVAFLGYRQCPDGSKGPAELYNLIRGVGDKIIAVNGNSTVNKSFQDIIALLKQSGKGKFALMRFLDQRYSAADSDVTSVGNRGRYAIEELGKKFSLDRKRVLVTREQLLVEEEKPDDKKEEDEESDSADGSDKDDDDSEGEFQLESDDEDPLLKANNSIGDSPSKETERMTGDEKDIEESNPNDVGKNEEDPKSEAVDDSQVQSFAVRPETTHSLANRLLHTDVGYSSDEGGDEDCAVFVDGVDDTFTARQDLPVSLLEKSTQKSPIAESKVPIQRTEFSNLGDRSKVVASVAVSITPPDEEYFDDHFPFPSKKAIAEIAAKAVEATAQAESIVPESPDKSVRRSTVNVEQISVDTGDIVNVWANVESAAATLQLPLNELRRIIREEFEEDFSDEVGGFRWQYAATGATVTAGEMKRKGISKQGREAWLEFRDRLYDPAEPHIYKNNNRLRDYQVEGVNWLASTFYRKYGCILADEMGLGKTVQIVSYLEHLFRVEKIRGPFLVVVPLSTIEHWRREFEGWTNMVACIYHDRQRIWRDVLREYEWYFEDKPHTAEFLKFHVLVTTYDTLISDFDAISQVPFRVAVVDEAHRLRNQKGKLLECMREISAKGSMQHGFQSRVLMSGTPLQNDLNELWTLLNFIEPFKFPELESFLDKFGNIKSREQVENLQADISPFMLRRVKEDVAKDIPAKEETVIDVELTAIQKQYYRAIFEHNVAFLHMGSNRLNAPKLMNIQMELRKACNHPCLLEGIEHREQDRIFKEFLEAGKFDGKAPEEQQHAINEQLYIQTSGKMVLMDKLLPKLRQEGHKILIFSQMVKMLDLISEYCDFRQYPYERLDGRVRGSDRQKSIDRFNKDKEAFLFLLSTRAGGVGINLTAADVCIIFDSDWNPQNDVQAQARCHRIGQTKDVRIYRLVTSRSFEQEMFDRASKKLGLEQAVLGTFGQDEEDDKPTNKEMEQLLKKGAYALLEDDNDEITQQFCADDIESILAKRTRTRVVEGAKTASWLNKQGMVVSKSKFTSDSTSAGLDMEDPDFWQKVLPDFNSPSIMIQKLEDLSHEVFGTTKTKKGPGRGRGRPKKSENSEEKKEKKDPDSSADSEERQDEESASNNEAEGAQGEAEPNASKAPLENGDDDDEGNGPVDDTMEDDEDEDEETNSKFPLTRTQQKKVAGFMSDLKSLMENLLEEAEDDNLQSEERAIAQKLLLTVSIKEKLFNEEHRRYARNMLKQLDGNRRRRCRTTDQQPELLSPGRKVGDGEIREELRIVSSKKKRRKKGDKEKDDEQQEESAPKRRKKPEIGEDGYKIHSDDEAEWSDVAEDDIYGLPAKKKATISTKEAKRRRQWASNDDAATAAGRPWPALPRDQVSVILATLLDETLALDKAKGGIFSEEVPRDEYPEYYEQIANPMDYGTMKKKLESGSYRSAQAMQKDFNLILQNCLKFNANDSEIVQEARQQALMRPNMLRNAALSNNLFLTEDGSVLYIVDEEKGKEKISPKRKSKGGKKVKEELSVDEQDGKGVPPDDSAKKPRLKISLAAVNGAGKKAKKAMSKNSKKRPAEEMDNAAPDEETESSKKSGKKAKTAESTKRKKPKASSKKKATLVKSKVDYTDVAKLKKERESLGTISFSSARTLFTKSGLWQLPEVLTDKFKDVALLTLKNIGKLDRYDLFAAPVSRDDIPDYYDTIKNPIDMATMKTKLEGGSYGKGNNAIEAFYDDLLLMMDNCRAYNDEDSEVTDEAARIFAHVPELYGAACVSVLKKVSK